MRATSLDRFSMSLPSRLHSTRRVLLHGPFTDSAGFRTFRNINVYDTRVRSAEPFATGKRLSVNFFCKRQTVAAGLGQTKTCSSQVLPAVFTCTLESNSRRTRRIAGQVENSSL